MKNKRYFIAFDSFLGRWYWTGQEFKLGFQYADITTIYITSDIEYLLSVLNQFEGSELPVFIKILEDANF
jgi:hypothetical protein